MRRRRLNRLCCVFSRNKNEISDQSKLQRVGHYAHHAPCAMYSRIQWMNLSITLWRVEHSALIARKESCPIWFGLTGRSICPLVGLWNFFPGKSSNSQLGINIGHLFDGAVFFVLLPCCSSASRHSFFSFTAIYIKV